MIQLRLLLVDDRRFRPRPPWRASSFCSVSSPIMSSMRIGLLAHRGPAPADSASSRFCRSCFAASAMGALHLALVFVPGPAEAAKISLARSVTNSGLAFSTYSCVAALLFLMDGQVLVALGLRWSPAG